MLAVDGVCFNFCHVQSVHITQTPPVSQYNPPRMSAPTAHHPTYNTNPAQLHSHPAFTSQVSHFIRIASLFDTFSDDTVLVTVRWLCMAFYFCTNRWSFIAFYQTDSGWRAFEAAGELLRFPAPQCFALSKSQSALKANSYLHST